MISIRFDARPMLQSEALRGISRRHVVLGGAAAALAVPLVGCGGAALFAPFFVFAFVGVVDRKIVSVSFSPPFSDQSSGRFDLGSFINVRDPKNGNFSVNSNFDGSFNGRDMQLALTTPLAPLAATYSGLFIEDETITLTPTDPARLPITVRLDRQNPVEQRFLPALTGNWVGTDANGAAWTLTLATDPGRLDPVNDPGEATVLLAGKERPGLPLEAALSGYASVRHIELDVQRPGGKVHLTGSLQADPAALKVGVAQVTATISFEGGGTLRRAP